MKQAIPESVLEKARSLRANGTSWALIARALGYGEEGIRRQIDEGFAARRAAGIRQARYSRGFRGEHVARLPVAEADAAIRSVPADTRPLSARIMGDPLPGRSALDKRVAAERNKNGDWPGKSGFLLDPGKHAVLIEDHLKFGSVV